MSAFVSVKFLLAGVMIAVLVGCHHSVPTGMEVVAKPVSFVKNDTIDSISSVARMYFMKGNYRKAAISYELLYSSSKPGEMRKREVTDYIVALTKCDTPPNSLDTLVTEIRKEYGEMVIPDTYYIYIGDFEKAYSSLNEKYKLLLEGKEDTRLLKEANHCKEISVLNSRIHRYERMFDALIAGGAVVIGCFIIFIVSIIVAFVRLVRWKINDHTVLHRLMLNMRKELVRMREHDGQRFTLGREATDGVRMLNWKENLPSCPLPPSDEENENSDNFVEVVCENNEELSPVKRDRRGGQLMETLFLTLDNLYSAYYRSEGNERLKKQILRQMELEIDKMRSQSDFLDKLEDEINEATNYLLHDVYGCMKRLSEKQRRLVAYSYFGFSTDTISLLLGIKPSVYYNRKSRLVNAIRLSGSSRKDELLALLL